MLNTPTYLTATFFICVLFTFYMFGASCKWNKKAMFAIIAWLGVQGVLGLFRFYLELDTIPPRFIFLVPPTLIVIIVLFISSRGKNFINSLSLKHLTLIHSVRIPVEFCLWWLFLEGVIPQLMTFEGRNFDIIAGITAPLIYYIFFISKKLSRKALLIWNVVSLLLLLNIVFHAILSIPSPFQQMAFEQPNIGILYFPYLWLPCFIVPVVLFSHLVAIRKLLLND